MLQTRENYIRSVILETTRDARLAFNDWDHETVLSASKTLLAVSDQMRKMKPADTFKGLDDMGDVLATQDGQEGDNGHKVESAAPEPQLPPSGGEALPETGDEQWSRWAPEAPDDDQDEAQPDLREPEPLEGQAALLAALQA